MAVSFFVNKRKFFDTYGTYYPEEERKSSKTIVCDMVRHIFKYGEVNKFYFAYGMDRADNHGDNGYMAYSEFMAERNKMNYTRPYDYLCILRDKNIFSIVAEAFNINVPKSLGMLRNGVFTPLQRNISEDQIWNGTDAIFIKAISGECGDKVFSVKKCEGGGYELNNTLMPTWDALKDYFKTEEFKDVEFVVQKCLRNHPVIDTIYPHSINTIRLVTIKNPKTGSVEPMAAVLRIGAHGNLVDNWAMGGLSVKVYPDGTLAEEGFYKPGYGTKTKIHPDTNVAFDKIKLPFYDECIDLCIKFHQRLAIHSIGWDVAITPEGPVIIEGNDNWEISLMQVSCGPLKAKFTNTLRH